MKLFILLNIFIIVFSIRLYSQENKTCIATRIDKAPKIDGVLNDECYNLATPAKDFIQYGPYNGNQPAQQTVAWFVYDNTALYAGIMLYDQSPDSIYLELGKRDGLETLNADLVSIDILPYNDGLNCYEFKVSASGVVSDTKYSPLGQYPAWDAIWESKVAIVDSGWIAEIKIPFSALRFPTKKDQVWGINMWRSVKRNGEWSTWDFVDKLQNNIFAEYGELKGISDIKQGVRLSLTPYISGYAEKYPGYDNTKYRFNGGMDLKYGINESFTLDATLIPDFGQVQSDDQVLNLTPFEIQYNEKRQFFVEGTEIFSKCGLFYSRRIGAQPNDYYSVAFLPDSVAKVISNPMNTRLINATKVSGRTKSGLGIGFFNAMTANTIAKIKYNNSDQISDFVTQPFTNYNLLVLDQNLPNNSYISLVNSNVIIPTNKYNANVTGTEFKIANKKSSYAINGTANLSQHYYNQQILSTGLLYKLELGKISGPFQYSISRESIDNIYNPNDLGYLQNNNEITNNVNFKTEMSKPKGQVLNWNNNLSINHNEQFTKHNFIAVTADYNTSVTFKNFMSTTFYLSSSPFKMVDYYEPRHPDYFFNRSGYFLAGNSYSSDVKKKISVHSDFSFLITNDKIQKETSIGIVPKIRFSDKLLFTYSLNYTQSINEYGFFSYIFDNYGNPNGVLFSKRDLITTINIIECQYTFSPKSSVSVRGRHYWSRANIHQTALLNKEGALSDFTDYYGDNLNFNIFNIDMQYTWNFAPGSELSVVWKNNISSTNAITQISFYRNINNLFKEPQGNSISVKLLYYIDYQQVFGN